MTSREVNSRCLQAMRRNETPAAVHLGVPADQLRPPGKLAFEPVA
jgi:hypothetical protein